MNGSAATAGGSAITRPPADNSGRTDEFHERPPTAGGSLEQACFSLRKSHWENSPKAWRSFDARSSPTSGRGQYCMSVAQTEAALCAPDFDLSATRYNIGSETRISFVRRIGRRNA